MAETCPMCKGRGQIEYQPPPGTKPAPGSETKNCPRCQGTGEVSELEPGEAAVPQAEVRPHERGGPAA